MTDPKSIINSFNHTQSNAFLLYKNETRPILSTQFKCPSIAQQIITKPPETCVSFCPPDSVLPFSAVVGTACITRYIWTEEGKTSSHLASVSPSTSFC